GLALRVCGVCLRAELLVSSLGSCDLGRAYRSSGTVELAGQRPRRTLSDRVELSPRHRVRLPAQSFDDTLRASAGSGRGRGGPLSLDLAPRSGVLAPAADPIGVRLLSGVVQSLEGPRPTGRHIASGLSLESLHVQRRFGRLTSGPGRRERSRLVDVRSSLRGPLIVLVEGHNTASLLSPESALLGLFLMCSHVPVPYVLFECLGVY